MGLGRRFLPCATLAALAWSGAALADGKDCTGSGSLDHDAKVESAKVTGAKTFFVKTASDDKACPADTAACRRKAFLLPGNAVLVTGRDAGFVCATFVNARGTETSGWLPAAAVGLDAPGAAPAARDWVGTWEREEAEIRIGLDAKGTLAIAGDATWGAKDPDRVKRGGVNLGSIAAKAGPRGDRLSFAMGDDDKTLPVDKGDAFTCRVWMRRVGAYLLVDDDNMCGGMNVTFRGTYASK